ncbi:MAG TPA: glycoside hydrolase family 11 protein [Polyangiaceae bacterium]|jgi:hypothetical protein|nr:glycoside hydrolase family 11 protein [Polyangiaceae bacterium]
MNDSSSWFKSLSILTPCLATLALAVGCSSDGRDFGSNGGATGSAGSGNTGGSGPHGGSPSVGGQPGSGGSSNGGSASNVAGGGQGSDPSAGSGGTGNGSSAGTGGGGKGGSSGKAGSGGGGAGGSGGKAGGSAGTSAGGGSSTGDACSMTTELTGGTTVQSSNKTGKAAGLDWSIWSNGSGGSITTYSVPAFSAAWNNSGDFLARLGLQWNASKTYDQYGTITAQFSYKKTGSGGGYSYIGMYGWSVTPCVEWYIVDDSYNKMPVNPGNTTNKGTVDIDGGKYTLYTRDTTGTGGSKCSGTTSWAQFYSIRQTARQCGQISVSEHFKAWAAAGMTLGKMDQAQILVEVGGGTGSIDFTVANVVTTM